MMLSEIIRQRIEREGPVSFRDFMEMALYYPGQGYYTSPEEKLGKQGDFYTSPYISALFGEMIGRQLEEMWHLMGRRPFIIVEYGSGTGILCRDILQYLKNNTELYEELSYCIIEKSASMREGEQRLLDEKVSWHENIRDIRGVTGCILSNEVVDNFSQHQVVMEDVLMEVFVGYDNGFIEILQPAAPALKEYFEQLEVVLPKGFRTEVNLQAVEWIKEIAEALKMGFVLTIDYGYPSSSLYSSSRRLGTVLCYNNHQVNDSPYNHIGEQDITAHVNFSALQQWGNKSGLEYCGFTNQAYFLLALGLTEQLRKLEQIEKDLPAGGGKKSLLINTFLMDMGRRFKVLIQQKGLKRPMLSGLRFPLMLA